MNQDARISRATIRGILIVSISASVLSFLAISFALSSADNSQLGMFGMLGLVVMVVLFLPSIAASFLSGFYSVLTKSKISDFLYIYFSSLTLTYLLESLLPNFFFHEPLFASFWIAGIVFAVSLLGGVICGLLCLLLWKIFLVLKQFRLR